MKHYPQGQTIHMMCAFAEAGVPVDPVGLRVETALEYRQPGMIDQLTERTFEYPGDLERLDLGSYALDFLPDGPGDLTWRWVSADGAATPDLHARVIPTRFAPVP